MSIFWIKCYFVTVSNLYLWGKLQVINCMFKMYGVSCSSICLTGTNWQRSICLNSLFNRFIIFPIPNKLCLQILCMRIGSETRVKPKIHKQIFFPKQMHLKNYAKFWFRKRKDYALYSNISKNLYINFDLYDFKVFSNFH